MSRRRGIERRSLTFIATALVLTCISARAETIAIVHAKAWTLTAATPVENATVVVSDGKIASVAADGAAPAGAR